MTKNKTHSQKKGKQIHSYSYKISQEKVSSFGGLALGERLASGLGFWSDLQKHLCARRGKYCRIDIIRGAVNGLLSGSRGTAILNQLGEDEPLLNVLGIKELPGEKIFWEELKRLGSDELKDGFSKGLSDWAVKLLKRTHEDELFNQHGLVPLFGDGTLLEGSSKREGTKPIPSKGIGLMWSNWFVGPVMATQHLSGAQEGEKKGLMDKLDILLEDVIDKLGWRSRSLVLMDSLHGDGPTLDRLEQEKLYYTVGANKLTSAQKVMNELPESVWTEVPSTSRRADCVSEQTCVASVQCEDWPQKRLLVCKRFKRDGDLFWKTISVMTNLPAARLQKSSQSSPVFAQEIWALYASKMGLEDYFKDALIDLSGHRPPCNGLFANRGDYALLSLAYNLERGIDLLGGLALREQKRQEAKDRGHKQMPSQRMRLWNLRRQLFMLPARIIVHARKATITLLGGGKSYLVLFEQYWDAIVQC